MPYNFSYVFEDALCAMAFPGIFGSTEEEDLAYLQQQGIRAIVSLTEEIPEPEYIKKYGFEWLHLEIEDYCPPTQEQIQHFVKQVDSWLKEGLKVMVHCTAGIGRTGTMLAAYFLWRDWSPDAVQAIQRIRELRPGSIETIEQERAIFTFAQNMSSS